MYQILSILDIKRWTKKYLYFSIFLIGFSIIYECFSHGVYSNYMIFAFLIPLVLGYILLPIVLNRAHWASVFCYHASIMTLTIGSVVKGVLDIYGTTNSLVIVYFIVGIVLQVISIIFRFVFEKSLR